MTEIKDGGAAFPLPIAVGPSGDLYDATQADPGMSLRDWFAGQILGCVLIDTDSYSQAAAYAYELADAMLEARKP